jgi:hypothetical protein
LSFAIDRSNFSWQRTWQDCSSNAAPFDIIRSARVRQVASHSERRACFLDTCASHRKLSRSGLANAVADDAQTATIAGNRATDRAVILASFRRRFAFHVSKSRSKIEVPDLFALCASFRSRDPREGLHQMLSGVGASSYCLPRCTHFARVCASEAAGTPRLEDVSSSPYTTWPGVCSPDERKNTGPRPFDSI